MRSGAGLPAWEFKVISRLFKSGADENVVVSGYGIALRPRVGSCFYLQFSENRELPPLLRQAWINEAGELRDAFYLPGKEVGDASFRRVTIPDRELGTELTKFVLGDDGASVAFGYLGHPTLEDLGDVSSTSYGVGWTVECRGFMASFPEAYYLEYSGSRGHRWPLEFKGPFAASGLTREVLQSTPENGIIIVQGPLPLQGKTHEFLGQLQNPGWVAQERDFEAQTPWIDFTFDGDSGPTAQTCCLTFPKPGKGGILVTAHQPWHRQVMAEVVTQSRFFCKLLEVAFERGSQSVFVIFRAEFITAFAAISSRIGNR